MFDNVMSFPIFHILSEHIHIKVVDTSVHQKDEREIHNLWDKYKQNSPNSFLIFF